MTRLPDHIALGADVYVNGQPGTITGLAASATNFDADDVTVKVVYRTGGSREFPASAVHPDPGPQLRATRESAIRAWGRYRDLVGELPGDYDTFAALMDGGRWDDALTYIGDLVLASC